MKGEGRKEAMKGEEEEGMEWREDKVGERNQRRMQIEREKHEWRE